jgi:transcriptional regulator GlxA family with amidase domain
MHGDHLPINDRREKEENVKRRVFMIGAGMTGAALVFSGTSIKSKAGDERVPAVGFLTRNDTINALRPPKRKRPLVAILADNKGSETTDLIVPWSVLKRSDAADVVIVSTHPGDVQLMPALKVQPDMTLDRFDALHKAGADYVIVPAFHNPKNQIAAKWMRQQHDQGATVAGVCSGALVLAHAGLLADRHATTHWYDRKKLIRISPTTKLQLNSRYLADRGVATTTGVSASLPFALTLVEAISGKRSAKQAAAEIGVLDFGQEHDSASFQLRGQNIFRIASNFFSKRDQFGLQIDGSTDELEIAFVADAWSRTYRSEVSTYSQIGADVVSSSNGMHFVPDLAAKDGSIMQQVPVFDGLPANSLAFTLDKISRQYGLQTANLVALQLEYDWSA